MSGRARRLAIGALVLLPALPWAQDAGPPADAPNLLRPDVEAFVAHMVQTHGFEPGELRTLLSGVKPSEGVQKAIAAPSTARPWHEFRELFVDQRRIDNGVKFWSRHEEVLSRARSDFGVPEAIIVSIIGIETRYGSYVGRFRTLDALYTLAFEGDRRADFFRGELEQFLVLSREQGWDATAIAGSFAGALGLPQFIPSSYRRYAIDYDGDGLVDLWDAPADAIGSVASYLKQFGWQDAAPVVAPARVETTETEALLALGLKPSLTLDEWRARGVEPMDGTPGGLSAALFRLDLVGGPEYWLGFDNFHALLQYNRSRNYAMAVHQLAQELVRERARLVAGMPDARS